MTACVAAALHNARQCVSSISPPFSQISDAKNSGFTVGQNVTVRGQLVSSNLGLVSAANQTVTLTYVGSDLDPVTAVTNLDGTFTLTSVQVLGDKSRGYTVGRGCGGGGGGGGAPPPALLLPAAACAL